MPHSHKSSNPVIIEVKNVALSYGTVPVLENINFTIHQGDYLGIIGPNGGGKTTLLKIMLGLLEPQQGSVTILGKNVRNLKDRSAIGYVPQRSSQGVIMFPATVQEFVESGRTAARGLLKPLTKEDRKKAQKALEITEITEYKNQLMSHLSGGLRQRAFLARALAGEPKILFLDEPTVAVDVGSSQKFYAFLGKLNREKKLTIIFVSHDIDCVYEEVNSVLCLNKTLICHGAPHTAMEQHNLEKLYGKKIKFIMHGHE